MRFPMRLMLCFSLALVIGVSCAPQDRVQRRIPSGILPEETRAIAALYKLGWEPTETDNPSLGDGGHIVQLTLWGKPGVQVTDKWLRPLRDLPKLRALYLIHAKITDAGLAELTGLSNLRDLGLEGSSITDEGLEHIARLPDLQRLAVSGRLST